MTPAAPGISVLLLGPLQARVAALPRDLGTQKQRTAFAVLAMQSGWVVPLDRMMDALWPDGPSACARKQVQIYVSGLRRVLGASAIETWADGYLLNVADVDVARFDRALDVARRARDTGDLAAACAQYANALGLWRDEPLSDLPLLRSHPMVRELSRRRTAAALDLAACGLAAGEHDRVAHHLGVVAAREPLNEAVHAKLMWALAGSGRRSDAIEIYHELRHRLASTLGVDPAPQLVEAYRGVLLPTTLPQPESGTGRLLAWPPRARADHW